MPILGLGRKKSVEEAASTVPAASITPAWRRLAPVRKLWPFVTGSGLAAMVFGLLYGECFGPTGLVPVVWLAPLDHPVHMAE